jgi:hypothetical protein
MSESAEEISKRFLPYSTVLLKLFIDKDGNLKYQHIGSGTYVTIGQIHAILTAQHCVVPLKGEYKLGLTAGREHIIHNFIVEKESIEIVEIASPMTEAYGPDMALIILGDAEKVGTIRSTNSFYNLSRDRDRMLNNPPQDRDSIWYFCGVPNERMVQTESEAGFNTVLEFQLFCGVGGINRYYEKDGYDYFETDIVDTNPSVPNKFGGMSGGGLWQVPVSVSGSNALTPVDHFLSGVIFYQGIGENDKKYLRCHGRRSIYEHVFEKLHQS